MNRTQRILENVWDMFLFLIYSPWFLYMMIKERVEEDMEYGDIRIWVIILCVVVLISGFFLGILYSYLTGSDDIQQTKYIQTK